MLQRIGLFAHGVTVPRHQKKRNKSRFIGDLVRMRRCRVGVGIEQVGRNGRMRLPLVRGSFRVDQQTTLDASEPGVPAVNGGRS